MNTAVHSRQDGKIVSLVEPLIESELFARVLLDPAMHDPDLDSIRIVSGYASAALAFGHCYALRERKKSLNVDLVYGMAGADGVSKSNHKGFLSLQEQKEFAFNGSFRCAYVEKPVAVHSKVYVWCRGEQPLYAFAGSANYTENGFRGPASRYEVLTPCDPISALNYFKCISGKTIACEAADIADFANHAQQRAGGQACLDKVVVESDRRSPFYGLQKVTLSLINKKGNPGDGSALNWGVRSGGRPRESRGSFRDPNQAYIRLTAGVYRTGFFPPIGARFTVLTDDETIFTCTRAQQNGKAIHTPQDNAELGRYFRKRLGLREGACITAGDLQRYGRTDVVFYRLDDENYIMDFAPPKRGRR